MNGRRVEFTEGWPGEHTQPGDYCKVPEGSDPRPGEWWYAMAPNGHVGAIGAPNHAVEEHEDGTISVTPSIVMKLGWHGFLTRGIWS